MSDDNVKVWRLYTYDVWGNEEDGFDINDIYRQTATIEIPEEATEAEVVKMLEENGDFLLTPDIAEIDNNVDTSMTMYFRRKDNGAPLFELRLEAK